ncbi:MAG: hypothetical protein JWM59_232 [Verrucomicrobiales bacterium]|nr:hypothetical protein [Verrucomicrobiales bacterium]
MVCSHGANPPLEGARTKEIAAPAAWDSDSPVAAGADLFWVAGVCASVAYATPRARQ